MKKLMIILVTLCTAIVNSQSFTEYIKDDYLKKHALKGGLCFVAGACDGQMETLRFHYEKFNEVFPDAYAQYWNPSLSHKNKYLNGDITQGEKFPLSSTSLVWTTDAYHMLKTVKKTAIFVAITINIADIGRRNVWCYVLDMAYYSLSYGAGFYITYDYMYR